LRLKERGANQRFAASAAPQGDADCGSFQCPIICRGLFLLVGAGKADGQLIGKRAARIAWLRRSTATRQRKPLIQK
jgi:hypothetical protein